MSLEPSSGPGRPAEYCGERCRNAARYRRDRELLRLGRAVQTALKSGA
jgi:hypothetical protein